ncbi:MAG: RagB/SusD family nutrient uptake outer membrane protein [Gemmatimonadetes bacterium]|nr:RagB/SusD family nutrient uptake outer membrane protein [Gemmatimonadota bacterium]
MRTTTALAFARGLRGLAAAAVVAFAAGCSTDDLLQVERPDVIPPESLQGALGATALYNGAIGDMAFAQGNFSGLMLASGLFSDEFRFGGTPPEVRQFDLGAIQVENAFSQGIWLNMHRGRQAAEKAAVAVAAVNAADGRVAELKGLAALATIWIGETYCSGTPFSDFGPPEVFGAPLSTQQTMDRAITLINEGQAFAAATPRVKNFLAVLKGRALLNNGQFAAAATAVASVPIDFVYEFFYSAADARTQNTMKGFIYDFDYMSVSDGEGGNGLNYASANDPRVPVTQDFGPVSRFDGRTPMFQFPLYNSFGSPIINASGKEAVLIKAEAALQANNISVWLARLNEVRATRTDLPGLTDPGTAAARVNLMFRERAFWMFATAHRLGDMRRLVRQYSRASNTIFPTGPYHKDQLTRGNQASIIIPQTEQNNPNYSASACDPTKA